MHQPGCLCHWQTVAKTEHWDMETPMGTNKGINKMWEEITFLCFHVRQKNLYADSKEIWYTSEKCAVAIAVCLHSQITLVKSGGGFFPLHKFESAHTAFLIIVRRFCLANSLRKKFHKHVLLKTQDQYIIRNLGWTQYNIALLLTAQAMEEYCSLWQSLCILCYLLLCFPKPILPEGQKLYFGSIN